MSDSVNSPHHYRQFDKEVKDIIRFVLGDDGYKAYCQGNEIKYRLRAGFKSDPIEDMDKALKYNDMRREVSNATPSDQN